MSRQNQRYDCSCGRTLKIPKRSGGSSRAWTATDYLVECFVYGGGGAIIGCALGVLIAMRLPVPVGKPTKYIVATFAVLGLLVGAVGGEPAINWIGRWLRDREDAHRLG
jgi:cell division protein FtsX